MTASLVNHPVMGGRGGGAGGAVPAPRSLIGVSVRVAPEAERSAGSVATERSVLPGSPATRA
jgi:hypothetical protein